MIDLHSHFLYAVDDGAKNLDSSLEMIIQAESVGISNLLATPHLNEHTTAEVSNKITETFSSLRELIRNNRIAVEIKLAAEVNVISSELFWQQHDWIYIGDENKYLLVETPFQKLPQNYSELLFQIRLKKITPILAHPERNVLFQKDPDPLFELINQGCLAQADAGSLTGQFGKRCQKFAWRLLEVGAIHLIGSDAHEVRWRNFRVLRDAYHKVESEFNLEYAQLLFNINPGIIWDGKKLSPGIIENYFPISSVLERIKRVLNR